MAQPLDLRYDVGRVHLQLEVSEKLLSLVGARLSSSQDEEEDENARRYEGNPPRAAAATRTQHPHADQIQSVFSEWIN